MWFKCENMLYNSIWIIVLQWQKKGVYSGPWVSPIMDSRPRGHYSISKWKHKYLKENLAEFRACYKILIGYYKIPCFAIGLPYFSTRLGQRDFWEWERYFEGGGRWMKVDEWCVRPFSKLNTPQRSILHKNPCSRCPL